MGDVRSTRFEQARRRRCERPEVAHARAQASPRTLRHEPLVGEGDTHTRMDGRRIPREGGRDHPDGRTDERTNG